MLTENDIQRIADRIVRGCAPLATGIFGSYATGFVRTSSDLDVFLIQRQPGGKPPARILAVKRHLWGILHPLDVFVFTPQEFEEAAYDDHSFISVIAKQARLYHWTDEATRLIPSLLPKADAWNGSRRPVS